MGNLKLKGKDILKLGYPNNQSVNVALEVMKRNFATKNIHHVKYLLKEILLNPEEFETDLSWRPEPCHRENTDPLHDGIGCG